MAWTQAVLKDIQDRNDGRVDLVIVYAGDAQESGVRSHPIGSEDFDATTLRIIAKNEVTRLNRSDVSKGKLHDLIGQQIDVVSPLPGQTPAEIARQQFFNDMGHVQLANTLISLGVLTGLEKEVTDLKTKLKTEYLPEYLGA